MTDALLCPQYAMQNGGVCAKWIWPTAESLDYSVFVQTERTTAAMIAALQGSVMDSDFVGKTESQIKSKATSH